MRFVAAAVILLSLLSQPGFGQTLGTISGAVKDPSGAVIPGATVTVKWNEGTSERSFDVVQFLVNELPMLAPTVDEENEVVPGQGPGAPPAPAAGNPATPPSPGNPK